jgi:hypothetical protein
MERVMEKRYKKMERIILKMMLVLFYLMLKLEIFGLKDIALSKLQVILEYRLFQL